MFSASVRVLGVVKSQGVGGMMLGSLSLLTDKLLDRTSACNQLCGNGSHLQRSDHIRVSSQICCNSFI